MSGRARGRLAALLLLLMGSAVGGLLAGCGSPTMLAPESKDAREIVTLMWILAGICGAIFLLVEGLLIASLVRSRRRPDDEVEQVYGNSRLETAWTVIPAIIVIVLFIVTVRSMVRIQTAEGQLPVRVVGHQWWWAVEYPDSKIATANEIHLPSDRSLDVSLESNDVIHSFWVPQLGGKTDVIPGRVNHTSYTDLKEGRYMGQCAEFCGAQHAHMRFWVVVDPPAVYEAWLRRQQQPAAPPQGTEAQAGARLFAVQPCAGCHTIRGTNAKGNTGPDLTHVGSRISIGAGVLENAPANMERWIRNPQQIKPGTFMPTLNLTDPQIRSLTAYLEGLR